MNDKDRDALQKSFELYRATQRGADEQTNAMLAEGRSWEVGAIFACECVQHLKLHLKPWELPPCVCEVDGPADDGGVKLLKRMLAVGVSKYHPDPMKAVEAVLAEQRLGTIRDASR
jgi:hypothetical protein